MNLTPCPYCGAKCERRDSSLVYGVSYGELLICSRYPACDAYVACHSDGRAMGTPARRELRTLRKRTHEAFDPLWSDGPMSRSKAYTWLAKTLGIPLERCHIGLFNETLCRRAIKACDERERVRSSRLVCMVCKRGCKRAHNGEPCCGRKECKQRIDGFELAEAS